ncbi:hypothetical protein TRAPUB_8788 [Trametes pubescens]|uniref:Uncharacterized protein n=1 Tax=Trametes pubescens TaxID=154538 RepID=A0A1M2W471_TRAPU|nr:hypothetical protein TRAPUB_8788 [Trametes pubescens]
MPRQCTESGAGKNIFERRDGTALDGTHNGLRRARGRSQRAGPSAQLRRWPLAQDGERNGRPSRIHRLDEQTAARAGTIAPGIILQAAVAASTDFTDVQSAGSYLAHPTPGV